jgi:hypothetical protein
LIQPAPLSLKLRFDRYLVDNRPYRFDLPLVELVEHVFCKRDFASVDLKPDETSSWRAIESEAACDARRLTDQELNVEIKVRDFTKIPLQHFAITRQPDRFAVVVYFVMNECSSSTPILPVETVDISTELRVLIGRMSGENPLWGAPRIHGELPCLAMRRYDCRSLRPCSRARRLSPLIAAWTSLASVGKVMALGYTVVSTVTRLRSRIRNAPTSCATLKLSASKSSSLLPSR